MVFQGWPGLARTGVVGALAYAGLVLFLRISGKRTLSKLNAFDLVVTVALGSTLATILLNEDVALAEGLVAFATLIGLQWAVAWTSVRWQAFARSVRAEPTVLLRDGEPLAPAMRRERVTESELLGAVREAGGARSVGGRSGAAGRRRGVDGDPETVRPLPYLWASSPLCSARRHGQRPSISISSEIETKVRITTMAASRPTLSNVRGAVMVKMMSAPTSSSSPSNMPRPRLARNRS